MLDWLTAPETWAWFLEPFEGQNWWQILNAGFIGTAISSVVGIFVALKVGQVATRETQQNKAKREAEKAEGSVADELSETESTQAPSTGGASSAQATAPPPQIDEAARQAFNTASNAIRRLKDYVDALADRCRDGRTRRKYENISRRDYRIITAALGEDGGLGGTNLERILAAFEEWRTYRNGRVAVPRDVAARLQDAANRYRVTTSSPAKWTPRRAESPPDA